MKIILAPDSFKGSLTAAEAACSMERGLRRVLPNLEILKLPVADGGEGTIGAFHQAAGGSFQEVDVTGPVGDRRNARFLVLPNGTAVMEMAEASGIAGLTRHQLDPLHATTFGTGELLRAILDHGCRSIIMGIGGSATNDGGAGMAQALGACFLNAQGRELAPGGAALLELQHIDCTRLDPRLRETSITVACDVTNPLCGEQGASAVYGPQKGATDQDVALLDRALAHYAGVLNREFGIDVATVAGAGAAGGLGAALLAFCNAAIRPGITAVLDVIGFDQALSGAGLILTGEGRIDAQTANGKVPVGVAERAKAHSPGIPVIAIAGGLGEGAEAVFAHGIDAILPIVDEAMPLEQAISHAGPLLEKAAERAFRLLLTGQKLAL